ncbi:MAG TPA: MFS transporter, partial [Acetobacteraceae bacterium]
MTDIATDDAVPPAEPTGDSAHPTLAAATNWQRTLWAMVGIQFVMTMSFSFLTPIMPLFLPVLGVHSAGAIDMWSGILSGSTSFVAAFASPVWGRLADQHGRKLMLLRSSCAIAVFTAFMGLSQDVWQFFAARALMGVFAGFSSTAMALVASQVPEGRLGYSLGLLSTGQLVGSLIGPVIGGVLSDLTDSYRIPFYCTSAVCFIALFMVWRGVREEFVRPVAGSRKGSTWKSMTLLVGAAGVLPLFFVLMMAQFSTRAVQPVVTLFVQQLVGPRPDLATLGGVAFSVTGLAGMIAVPLLGRRSDQIGYRRVLLICLLGATLTSLPQGFATNYWTFAAERFGVGLFIGGILPAANALIGRMVARSDRGLIYGMSASATFIGNSLGPLTGGAVAASLGLRWVFFVTAALLLVNLVWVYFNVREYREPD